MIEVGDAPGAVNDPSKSIDRGSNELLGFLRESDWALLSPYITHRHAPENQTLYSPGDDVGVVYFPLGPTLVSFVVDDDEGHSVETMIVGREGAVGGIVSAGHLPAYSRIMVQFAGDFLTLPVNVLNDAKNKSPALQNLFARYADCLLAQIFQSTTCNAIHTIEQRVCKWIIAAIDRTGGDAVPMTQERLAAMLGVGRSYVTRLVGELKRRNLIAVSRGKLRVIDQKGVEQTACSCNNLVKNHYKHVMSFAYLEAGE